tara:strand:+ start:696 stop:1184 length:489 start_codon:yes stop_codon:yes gene_type:complete
MKKKYYFLISCILLILTSHCTGYKPIFSSTDLKFKIEEHKIGGDKALSNDLFTRLNRLSDKSNENIKSVYLDIFTAKDKASAVRDLTGKTIEYKITLTIKFVMKDYLTEDSMLNETFTSSLTYKIQDNYSETVSLENSSYQSLLNKIYQELLIKLSERIINE